MTFSTRPIASSTAGDHGRSWDGRITCDAATVFRPPPFAELPERIEFDLDEVRLLLEAFDLAAELATPGSDVHDTSREAVRLITAKLWPDLGDLLQE